ncbi:MAG: hypothetical protein ACLU3I_00325 [Acutalibacteraceae bacterium]
MTSTPRSWRSSDEDYALFYRDITEEPKKYAGKTVSFKGQVARLRRGKGRHVCPRPFRDDLLRGGYHVHGSAACRICRSFRAGGAQLGLGRQRPSRSVPPLYKGVGPILTAVNVQPAEPAEQSVATF